MQDMTIGNKTVALTQVERMDQPASPSRRRLVRDISLAMGAAAIGASGLVRAASSAQPQGHPSAGVMGDSNDWEFGFMDPLTDVKALIQFGGAFLPEPAGALIDVLLDLFWPERQADVWKSVVNQVTEEIKDAIYRNDVANETEKMQQALGNTPITSGILSELDGLSQEMKKSAPDISGKVKHLLTLFPDVRGTFQPDDAAWPGKPLPTPDVHQPGAPKAVQTLGIFVQFANLHILFLRDQILNGHKFGLSQNAYDLCLTELRKILLGSEDPTKPAFNSTYQAYVDTQMAVGRAWLEAKYQDMRKYISYEDACGGCGPTRASGRASGAWLSKQMQNGTLTYLEHTVVDFRKLWDLVLDKNGEVNFNPPQLVLDREVYLGPYGVPDLNDTNWQGTYEINASKVDWPLPSSWTVGSNYYKLSSTQPFPDVPPPHSTEGERPLMAISIDFGNFTCSGGSLLLPHFSGIKVAREPTQRPGDSWTGYFNSGYWMETNQAWGGEIVSIQVRKSEYLRRYFFENHNYTGEIISGIVLTSKNGTTHDWGWHDNRHADFNWIATDTLPVPKDHVLSGITPISGTWNYLSYLGIQANSAGSMTFGFKLKDPILKLSTSLLQMVYKTSPTQLSVADVAHFARNVYHARGWDTKNLVALESELVHVSQNHGWDAKRHEYLQMKMIMSDYLRHQHK